MEPFYTFEHVGYTIELHYDEDSMSPADWDNLGTLVLSRALAREWGPRGVETMSGDEEEALERGGFRVLYRYLRLRGDVLAAVPFRFEDYGSSGYRMYATDADDGRVDGYIYTTTASVRACCGEGEPYDSREWQEEALRGELEEWRSYVEGEVAGYVVRDSSGAVVDSLWGYYPDANPVEPDDVCGYVGLVSEAIDAAEYERAEREHAANQDVATA